MIPDFQSLIIHYAQIDTASTNPLSLIDSCLWESCHCQRTVHFVCPFGRTVICFCNRCCSLPFWKLSFLLVGFTIMICFCSDATVAILCEKKRKNLFRYKCKKPGLLWLGFGWWFYLFWPLNFRTTCMNWILYWFFWWNFYNNPTFLSNLQLWYNLLGRRPWVVTGSFSDLDFENFDRYKGNCS